MFSLLQKKKKKQGVWKEEGGEDTQVVNVCSHPLESSLNGQFRCRAAGVCHAAYSARDLNLFHPLDTHFATHWSRSFG